MTGQDRLDQTKSHCPTPGLENMLERAIAALTLCV